MADSYVVMGVHDHDVDTVEGNVVRVRMFIGDTMVDEDFALPSVITVEEQIDKMVNARMQEITEQGTDAKSKIVDEQSEQIVGTI